MPGSGALLRAWTVAFCELELNEPTALVVSFQALVKGCQWSPRGLRPQAAMGAESKWRLILPAFELPGVAQGEHGAPAQVSISADASFAALTQRAAPAASHTAGGLAPGQSTPALSASGRSRGTSVTGPHGLAQAAPDFATIYAFLGSLFDPVRPTTGRAERMTNIGVWEV